MKKTKIPSTISSGGSCDLRGGLNLLGTRHSALGTRPSQLAPHASPPYPRSMPEQYAATDKRTGLEVAVTGEFPPHHDDRIRIARTTTLFTRLMSTILATENETERRERFHAIETQLEMADALIRQDMEEVQRLMKSTLEKMGISADQMDDMAKKILEQLREGGTDFPEFPEFPTPPPAEE